MGSWLFQQELCEVAKINLSLPCWLPQNMFILKCSQPAVTKQLLKKSHEVRLNVEGGGGEGWVDGTQLSWMTGPLLTHAPNLSSDVWKGFKRLQNRMVNYIHLCVFPGCKFCMKVALLECMSNHFWIRCDSDVVSLSFIIENWDCDMFVQSLSMPHRLISALSHE